MDIDDLINMEVIRNPAYWVLTIMFEIAILIGFKGSSLWMGTTDTTWTIPFLWKVIILIIIPVIAYFMTWKFMD